MNCIGRTQDDLYERIQDFVLDGVTNELTKDNLAKLETLLLESDDACLLYFKCVAESDIMQVVMDMISAEESLPLDGDSPKSPPLIISQPSFSPLLAAFRGTIGFFSQEVPFGFLIATLLTGLLLLGMWLTPVSHPVVQQIAGSSQPAELKTPAIEQKMPEIEYVGHIVDMVDCKFSVQGAGTENHKSEIKNQKSLVALGDKLILASGLMEIAYDTGARVILQGPCTYTVESTSGGYLAFGKLTASLEKIVRVASGSESNPEISASANPQSLIPDRSFFVRTPTAIVTDLGTEFGVEVENDGRTTSHVFRGLVRFQTAGVDGKAEGKAKFLCANQSARVETNESPGGASRMTVFVASAQTTGFVRAIPKRTLKTFDLVDAVAGGNGFSGKRNRGIDPTTGRRSNSVDFESRKTTGFFPTGDGQYHRVEELPFVDGVFIPDRTAGLVRVDSAGHVFTESQENTNQTANLIWAGGNIPTVFASIPTVLNGVDYARQGHGLLFVHPNSGITFDLDAIRRANPGCTIRRFLSVVGNTEQGGGETAADCWVLVDGKVQFRRRQFNSYNGSSPVAVPIKPNDRFLTLVTTDGGDGLAWDWVIFGDPRLQLIEAKNNQQPGSTSEGGAPRSNIK